MRGKQCLILSRKCCIRITPAGAGKTATVPRVSFAAVGSPPQVRGKHAYGAYQYKSRGITPAGAGKTISVLFFAADFEDHPRRCGENQRSESRICCMIGSPPQVRGKPLCSRPPTAGNRITPAGAGKTHLLCSFLFSFRDHPRRCGENRLYQTLKTNLLGSPPQVRGKPTLTARDILKTGITPAGAGKTATEKQAMAAAWDHPRRCGENFFACRNDGFARGSPPQVRGKRANKTAEVGVFRITPAGAGKT